LLIWPSVACGGSGLLQDMIVVTWKPSLHLENPKCMAHMLSVLVDVKAEDRVKLVEKSGH
jgi:hypothetical protein